jgi:potassium-transporting ATPase KdpC subunit
MKPTLWRWILLTTMVVAVAVAGIVKFRGHRAVRPVSTREEIAVAERLLVDKLSGPRYFNAPASGIPEEGGPWIDAKDARSQVERVVAERKLGPEGHRKVEQFIEKLTEPYPSRMVGGERINLLRLNLSLDAIEK